MIKLNFLLRIVLLASVISSFSSCVSRRKITYFVKEDTTQRPLPTPYEPVIQPNDRIAILVTSVDKKASAFFTFSLNDNSSNSPSYLVNPKGDIDIPLIGKWHVAGYTTSQAKDSIKKLIEGYIIDPTVIVALKTFRVTVLGYVGAVGIQESDNEKMTLTDVIAKAGDIQINGRRDKILVIRERGNGKEYGYVDLTSKEVFTSPYYYLHANDIVYVEPSIRVNIVTTQVYYSAISLAIGFFTLAVLFLKKTP
jgi:polysaccharide export outer membrane protein